MFGKCPWREKRCKAHTVSLMPPSIPLPGIIILMSVSTKSGAPRCPTGRKEQTELCSVAGTTEGRHGQVREGAKGEPAVSSDPDSSIFTFHSYTSQRWMWQTHACNTSTWEAETRGLSEFKVSLEQSETLLQASKQTNKQQLFIVTA